MGYRRWIAWRYVQPRAGEGFVSLIAALSFIGIALGVAALIIVMSVMNGFRSELLGRVLGLNGHLAIYADAALMEDDAALIDTLRRNPQVLNVAPLVEGQAMVSTNANAGGALVRGLALENLLNRPLLLGSIVQGALTDLGDDSVAIGYRLAERYNVKLGDYLTLISPRGSVTAFGSMPRYARFRVAAIFNAGMFEFDSGYIYTTLSTAQNFYNLGDRYQGIELLIKNPAEAGLVAVALQQDLPYGMRTVTWQQANGSLFTALQVERNVMFMILTLIIVVAALNIISSQVMLVKDKARAIAILRTMGASKASIMTIFMLNGATLGITGTLLGLLLGVVGAHNIETLRQAVQWLTGTNVFNPEVYLFNRLPSEIIASDVIAITVVAFVLSIIATIYPAWRAAKTDPVVTLRYE